MVLRLLQSRRHGMGALVNAAFRAATVWIPSTEGHTQSATGPLPERPELPDLSAGSPSIFTMLGMENHWGAERSKRSANSMAAASNLSCCAVARYRSNSASQVSACPAREPPGARISSKPASAPASSPLAKRMAASSRSASCATTSSTSTAVTLDGENSEPRLSLSDSMPDKPPITGALAAGLAEPVAAGDMGKAPGSASNGACTDMPGPDFFSTDCSPDGAVAL